MSKQKGTEARESAEQRVKEQARLSQVKPLTGQEIFDQCLAQGLVATFNGDNFVAYVDQYSKKKVITRLPALTIELRAEFLKAAKDHAQGDKKQESKKEKIAATPKPPKDKRGTADTRIISVLTDGGKNPWKEGTKRHELWALYSTCKTVGEYYAAGGDSQYVMRDKRRGFISIT